MQVALRYRIVRRVLFRWFCEGILGLEMLVQRRAIVPIRCSFFEI